MASQKFSFKPVNKTASPAPAADAAAAAKPVEPVTPAVTVPAPVAVAKAFAEPAPAVAAAPVVAVPTTPAPTVAVPTPAPVTVAADPFVAALKASGLSDAQIAAVLAIQGAAPAPTPAPAPVVTQVATQANAPVEVIETRSAHSPAIVAPAAGALVEHKPASYGDDADDINSGDVKFPRVNVVANVGELMKVFNPGDLLLNQETVIVESPKTSKNNQPVNVIVVGVRPDRYVEKREGGEMGQLFDTEAEVAAVGGTLNYGEAERTGKPLYQALAEMMVLIEKPEHVDDPSFSYLADGKLYALALWSFKGAAYTHTIKGALRPARKFGWLKDKTDPIKREVIERGAYYHGWWKVNTLLKNFKTGNSAWVADFTRGGETSPELRALAQSILG